MGRDLQLLVNLLAGVAEELVTLLALDSGSSLLTQLTLDLIGSILAPTLAAVTALTVKQLLGRSSIPFNGISNGDWHLRHTMVLLEAMFNQ